MWESRSARLESQTSNLLTPHPAALSLRSQLGHSAEWGEEQGKGRPACSLQASRCFLSYTGWEERQWD